METDEKNLSESEFIHDLSNQIAFGLYASDALFENFVVGKAIEEDDQAMLKKIMKSFNASTQLIARRKAALVTETKAGQPKEV